LPVFPATLRKQLGGARMPAAEAILAAAVEGAEVDFDTASRIETRYFVDVARGQIAKNMIKALWFDLNAIKAGGSRPAEYPKRQATKVAVVGAGMMGAALAYVNARSGIDVVLKDVSADAAEKGKDRSRSLLDAAVSRGSVTADERERILSRITPTSDYADLAGCDLVIEAVFENQQLKQQVFRDLEGLVADDALLGSNTSTLPITELAASVQRKDDFIGLHFFSPADKMPLLEIIRGKQTSDATLARALDYAQQIRKTPIVVNDSRGFFTSRVITLFCTEALTMLAEGMPPVTIERSATQAGYRVGPLQLLDELNLELTAKIRNETKAAVERSGRAYDAHPGEIVLDRMVQLGRTGRAKGAGFYEYADGRRTGLWPGLREEFPPQSDPGSIDLTELEERFLFVEALDAARCLEEGVLTSVADANVGSIMGIGYPAWTGGVLQYITGYGLPKFVVRADELADRYGERFRPSELLRRMADEGEGF
jgi:3-hydroxyacyl-CoA dehydrogenase / enoyl-CoA hydratase / 3-hydroxybutyryl-CoA epimerase